MKTESKTILLLAGLSGLLLAAGCGSTTATVQDLSPASADSYKTDATGRILLLSHQEDRLRLKLEASGSSDQEQQLAVQVARKVSQNIGESAKVVNAGNYDVNLTITPTLSLLDQSGEYYRMKCDIRVTLKPQSSSRVYSAHSLSFPSERKLGKSEVIKQFSVPAGMEISTWCKKELAKVSDEEIGVAMLTIQLPKYFWQRKRRPDNDMANTKEVGDKLAAMPSLMDYEFIAIDETQGTCVYRVVYFKSAYPNGFANEASVYLRK